MSLSHTHTHTHTHVHTHTHPQSLHTPVLEQECDGAACLCDRWRECLEHRNLSQLQFLSNRRFRNISIPRFSKEEPLMIQDKEKTDTEEEADIIFMSEMSSRDELEPGLRS